MLAADNTNNPEDLGLGMGQSEKYSYVVPSQGLAMVTLELTWESSRFCPLGLFSTPPGTFTANGTAVPVGTVVHASGYDDSFSATQVWRALGNLAQGMAPHFFDGSFTQIWKHAVIFNIIYKTRKH
jgi:hypothetical protein